MTALSSWVGSITAIAAGYGTPIVPSTPPISFVRRVPSSFCNPIGINLSGVIFPTSNPYTTIPFPTSPFALPVGSVSEAMLAYK